MKISQIYKMENDKKWQI